MEKCTLYHILITQMLLNTIPPFTSPLIAAIITPYSLLG